MNRRQIIGTPAVASALPAASPRDRFLGVWRLVRCESRFPDGRIEKPVGRNTYDKAGPALWTAPNPSSPAAYPATFS